MKKDKKKLVWNKKSLQVLQDSLLEEVVGAGTQVCSHSGYTTYDTGPCGGGGGTGDIDIRDI